MANASGIKAGSAYVEIGGKEKGALAAFERVRVKLQAIGSGMRNVAAIGLGVGTAITGAFGAAIHSFEQAGSELLDTSNKTGASVESLSLLKYAAEQTGSSLEAVAVGAKKAQRSISEARDGNKEASEQFDKLGLSVDRLSKMDPGDQLMTIGRAIANMKDPADRTAASMALLGKSGNDLLEAFRQLPQFASDMKALGIGWTTKEAEIADEIGDRFTDVRFSIQAVWKEISMALAPSVLEVTRVTIGAIAIARGWISRNKEIIALAAKSGAALITAAAGLYAVGGALSIIAVLASVPALKIAAAVLLIGALAAALLQFSDYGREVFGQFATAFQDVYGIVRDTIGAIGDALVAGDIEAAVAVLWAGVKAAWLAGTAPLANIFRDAMLAIKSIWIELQGWFWTNFPKFSAGIAKAWSTMWAALAQIQAHFNNVVANAWFELQKLLDPEFDIEWAKKLALDDLNTALDEANSTLDKELAEIERKSKLSPEDIARETQAARDKAAADSAKARSDAASELADAKDALNKAKADASKARELKKIQSSGNRSFGLPDIGESVQNLKQVPTVKLQAVGTFSGRAAEQLGSENSLLVRETKKVAENTKKTADILSRGGPRFK